MQALRLPGATGRAVPAEYLLPLAGAGYALLLLLLRPEAASGDTLRVLLETMLPLLVVTIGQTFVLLVRGIDLSAPSVVALASVVGASLVTEDGGLLKGNIVAVPAAVLAMLLLGVGVGVLHGLAVAVLGLPAFLVTLASLMALGGVAVWATQSKPVADLPDSFLALGQGAFLGVPAGVWLAGAVALAAHLLLAHTVLGRQMVAAGLNPRAALVAGVPLARVQVVAFALSGACAALAALLYVGRLEVGHPALVPREVLLDSLGAAVLGGVSLRGGKGSVPGVVLGVFFIALFTSTLPLLDLGYWHVNMAKGGVILLAALLDAWRQRRAGGR